MLTILNTSPNTEDAFKITCLYNFFFIWYGSVLEGMYRKPNRANMNHGAPYFRCILPPLFIRNEMTTHLVTIQRSVIKDLEQAASAVTVLVVYI